MMMEFAARLADEDAHKGYWVLAVDPIGERFLLARDEGGFRWVAITDCVLVKAISPEQPRPVITIQAPPALVLDPRKLGGGNGP